MLPNAGLKPAYDKVAWLYVYRDFSNSETDLNAERISLRMGVTSWPQHILVDPQSLQTLGSTGRSVESFLRAVDAIKLKPSKSTAALTRIKAADVRAKELETKPTVDLATQRLADNDIVVRYRALRILAEQAPQVVAGQAVELLGVPNDPFRYEVCSVLSKSTVLSKAGEVEAKSALERLVRKPSNSKNPNVLRMRAVQALSTCGDAQSIDVIQPFTKGSYLNSLTKTAVDALAIIAERDPDAKQRVQRVLVESFPQPPSETMPTHSRLCVSLAKTVHRALERITDNSRPFPDDYDAATRNDLMQAWLKYSMQNR